jgi:hypothetical protein
MKENQELEKSSKAKSTKEKITNLALISLYVLLLASLSAVLLPMVVTWDGYLYLGSAEAFLIQDFRQYHWLREPLYPLYLALTLNTGGAQLLVFSQSLMLSLGVILLSQAFKGNTTSLFREIFKITVVQALMFGFSATVLQQPLIFFLLSLVIFFLLAGKSILAKMGFWITFFLLTLTSLQVSIGFVLAAPILWVFRSKLKLRQVFINSASLILVGLLAFSGWQAFKAQNTTPDNFWGGKVNFWEYENGFNNYDFLNKLSLIPSTYLALNSAGVEFYIERSWVVGFELRTYGTPIYSPNETCGKILNGPVEYANAASPFSFFEQSCVSQENIFLVNAFAKIVSGVAPALTISAFLMFCYLALRRFYDKDWPGLALLALLPIVFAPYLYANAAISRYGLPLVALNIVTAIEYGFMKFRSLPRGKYWNLNKFSRYNQHTDPK